MVFRLSAGRITGLGKRCGIVEASRTSEVPHASRRALSTSSSKGDRPLVARRAMLYVPSSNPRMLEKSFASPADSVCYDLEDSVAPGKKDAARSSLVDLLNGTRSPAGEVMVRVNAVDTEWCERDVDEMLRTTNIQAIALPKTNDPSHLEWLVSRIDQLSPKEKRKGGNSPIRIIGMIESAEAMVKVHDIAKAGQGHLDGLLFAAEDYCADVGITRTEDRSELLYPRSRLVTAAKAHGLQAIDLVCVDYKDTEALRRECDEGRRLGFDGKQAIHPAQIDVIHSSFSPAEQAIRHAARVKFSFEHNDRLGKGSYSLDSKMIDAPVYKQALKVLAQAKAAGLEVPRISESDISP